MDGDALTLLDRHAADARARSGAVSGDRVLYTPNANANGPDSLRFRVDDGEAERRGDVSISVAPVNDVPVAGDDAAAMAFGTATDIAVLGNDTDVETDGARDHGHHRSRPRERLSPTAGGIQYTPDAGSTGLDTFEYTVDDGDGGERHRARAGRGGAARRRWRAAARRRGGAAG